MNSFHCGTVSSLATGTHSGGHTALASVLPQGPNIWGWRAQTEPHSGRKETVSGRVTRDSYVCAFLRTLSEILSVASPQHFHFLSLGVAEGCRTATHNRWTPPDGTGNTKQGKSVLPSSRIDVDLPPSPANFRGKGKCPLGVTT